MLPPLPPVETTLSPLFSDSMVLQRGRLVPVFGTDAPGTEVRVQIAGKVAKAKAGPDGRWTAMLPKMEAGGPFTMTVQGTATRSVKDVLVGEVWVCSGQSNMEWTIDAGTDMQGEKANPPSAIRMFTVQKNAQDKPQRDLRGSWAVASPTTLGAFSAVGYSFAKTIYDRLKVPIGMIHTSWGGTNAESWTTLETLATDPITKPTVDRYTASMGGYPAALERYNREIAAAQDRVYPELKNPGEFARWAAPEFDDADWEPVVLPHLWPATLDGVIWYRVTVELTAEEAERDQTLSLGPIDDADVTYVNGVEVARTDMTVPNFYSTPRNYSVPRRMLRAGKNVIAIRVFDFGGGGGFSAKAEEIRLGDKPLTNARMKTERTYTGDARQGANFPQAPVGPNDPNLPSALMNGMIDPVIPYAIKGAIWYQGENNAGRAEQYRTLFPMMIGDWRRKWGQGDFPFYWVSLAAWQPRKAEAGDSAWAELRDAQHATATLPNSGYALAIDIGDAENIHPPFKKEVGRRLALNALNKTYAFKGIPYQGPTIKSAKASGDRVTVVFDHARGLTTTDGASPKSFAVAGADGVYHRAEARIEGLAVVLTSALVPMPKTARYAWEDNPEVNLVNADRLPAVPFRTDAKPLITSGQR